MALVYLPDIRLNAVLEGPATAPPVVLLHALGTDLTIWDQVAQALQPGNRVLRIDLRGHGKSDATPPPYTLGQLTRDVERVIDHFALRDVVLAGVSLGGMVAQALAVKRPDLIRALVLSNTAAKLGGPTIWAARREAYRAQGAEAYGHAAAPRWLGPRWQTSPHLPRLMALLAATPAEGWEGAVQAIAQADLYVTTATLRLPTLVIAGGRDGTTPPDLVRETADLIPGHRFHLFPRAGHFPMVEDAPAFTALLAEFLSAIGHR